MKTRLLKNLIYFFCFISLLLIIIFYGEKKDFIKLSFLDVGQGDATLINFKNKKIILIDGGPDNLVLRSLGRELPFYKKKIDVVIISHFHHDHITGLIEIFRRYQVDLLVYGQDLKQFPPHTLLLAEANKQDTKIITLENNLNINLGEDCDVEIYHPQQFAVDNDNDSLITKLDCHDFSFLSSGDNEGKIEKGMLEKSIDISAQIFKASHHGSKTSNSYDFLQVVRPKIIVISVGADNKFGHPAPEVISTISKLGIRSLATSEEGTIRFFTDFR